MRSDGVCVYVWRDAGRSCSHHKRRSIDNATAWTTAMEHNTVPPDAIVPKVLNVDTIFFDKHTRSS